MISLQEFLTLGNEEVARYVRAAGPQVCVFPINGTRRWFVLEHGGHPWDDPVAAFMDIASQNHIALYRLFFDHGIDTLLTPVVGPDILTREEYMARIGAQGYARLVQGEDFLRFYEAYGVRVRFYGDYHQALSTTPYAYLSELFDSIATRTHFHKHFRLFFGAFADDVFEALIRLAVAHYTQTGKLPDRQTLVTAYYGEYIPPATLFIGFDRFNTFDYPLLASGQENLYFTVAPSPYLNVYSLRRILYDHLFTRRAPDPDYARLPARARADLHSFYRTNQTVHGVGDLLHGVWIPHTTWNDHDD